MVCSGLCPRTCTNKVLWFCERSININANHLKILPSALFLFFNSTFQIGAFRWCNCSPGAQAELRTPHKLWHPFLTSDHIWKRMSECVQQEWVCPHPGVLMVQRAPNCPDPLHGSSPWCPAPTWRMLTLSQRNVGSRVCGVPHGPSSHPARSAEGAQCPTGITHLGVS